jgi:membrane-bound ClpP family serine protease
MIHSQYSKKTIVRYTLLQLPGLLLIVLLVILVKRYFDFSWWFMGGIIVIWILKDIVLFPFVWRAYDWKSHEKSHSMLGLVGNAVDRLAPEGYVKVRGELWRAEVIDRDMVVEQNRAVRVEAIRGLTLLVRPQKDQEAEKSGPH